MMFGHGGAARPAINQPAHPGYRPRLSFFYRTNPPLKPASTTIRAAASAGRERPLQIGARPPDLRATRGELATRRDQRDDRSHTGVIARISPLYLMHLTDLHLMPHFLLAYLTIYNI
jgi:hypothetical protein